MSVSNVSRTTLCRYSADFCCRCLYLMCPEPHCVYTLLISVADVCICPLPQCRHIAALCCRCQYLSSTSIDTLLIYFAGICICPVPQPVCDVSRTTLCRHVADFCCRCLYLMCPEAHCVDTLLIYVADVCI